MGNEKVEKVKKAAYATFCLGLPATNAIHFGDLVPRKEYVILGEVPSIAEVGEIRLADKCLHLNWSHAPTLMVRFTTRFPTMLHRHGVVFINRVEENQPTLL